MRVLSEVSVDLSGTGMSEVESCLGRVGSEAADRENASELDELDHAQQALGTVWL